MPHCAIRSGSGIVCAAAAAEYTTAAHPTTICRQEHRAIDIMHIASSAAEPQRFSRARVAAFALRDPSSRNVMAGVEPGHYDEGVDSRAGDYLL